jgi:hypothetical protein
MKAKLWTSGVIDHSESVIPRVEFVHNGPPIFIFESIEAPLNPIILNF